MHKLSIPLHSKILYIKILHINTRLLACRSPVKVKICVTKPLFSSLQNSKTLQDFTSHRIFKHMHEVLNVAKQNN